jgi:hypothetical protein
MTFRIPRVAAAAWFGAWALLAGTAIPSRTALADDPASDNQVLKWNQIFIETLIATNTPNSSSQRLGAIVHTAIFDAYNGVERRYRPILVRPGAAPGASRRAAVIAAAHTALVGLFPARQAELDSSYAASLAALREDSEDCGVSRDHSTAWHSRERANAWQSRQRGLAWGTQVAQAVLERRATDGFNGIYTAFAGGLAVGQWRPVAPAIAMSAQGLAFTDPFVLVANTQFRPPAPRALDSATYVNDFNAVKGLGRMTGSTRTEDQSSLAPFWEGNASVHWNQAANQIARSHRLSLSSANRLLAVLNIAMADTAMTIWSAKRFYGEDAALMTWRPITAITLAATDGNPGTIPDVDWKPLVPTPSHPEYPAGHPSLNGAAASVLLAHFGDRQTFKLTTTGQPNRTYTSIRQARADANNARVWGGMHYPSTVAISDAVGRAIARYVDRNSMQRLHWRRHGPGHAVDADDRAAIDELAP